MAKIKLDPLFAGISGKMGNFVIKKSRNGKTILAHCPDMSRVEPSRAQLAQREAFTRASAYTKSALADETTRAFYQALAEGRDTTARAVCMGDSLNAPSMDDMDFSRYYGQVGDCIRITTHDDVGVVEVHVRLAKTDGSLIEYGKAVELFAGSGYWEYVATVPVPLGTDIVISAEAFDRPRNRVAASADLVVGEGRSYRFT